MKLWIPSVMELHDCHQFVKLLRGFQNHSLAWISPILPSDVVPDTGDCPHHTSTCFVDERSLSTPVQVTRIVTAFRSHLIPLPTEISQLCCYQWCPSPIPPMATQQSPWRLGMLRALLSLHCSQSPLQSWQ